MRLVHESEGSHPSRWAALVSVSGKIGCTAETLRRWVHEAEARSRKSLPPGRYFRMLLVGYFEGIDSERGIEWRCADSLSLRAFLLLESRERCRIIPGCRRRARVCLRRFMIRSLPECCSGWPSTASIWIAVLSWPHRCTTPIWATLLDTLAETEANLAAVDLAPTCEEPAELVADKGYHSRDRLKELHDSAWKTRISEPAPPSGKDGILRWHGDENARRAVYANRRRLLAGVAGHALKLRAEIVERAFALTLDRGGMCRTWLRWRDNVQNRYLIHIAGYIIMRLLTDRGTPRRWAAIHPTLVCVCTPLDDAHLAVWIAIVTNREPLPVAGACLFIATAKR